MAINNNAIKISQKHLLGIQDLSISDVKLILDEAKKFISLNKSKNKKLDILRGKTQINLFFEPSTRTQSSFELAGKRLGADVMSMNITNSAIKKGETLIDTAMTLNAMHPDIIVVRHQDSGASNLLSQKVNCSVLNAGDGRREHPTQALLDALTIIEKKKKIEEVCSKRTIIASSTSGIKPTDLQKNMQNPERLMVTHPFNPVYLIPLVEVVGGNKTEYKFIKKIHKEDYIYKNENF